MPAMAALQTGRDRRLRPATEDTNFQGMDLSDDIRACRLSAPRFSATWRTRVREGLGPIPPTLLVGGTAILWHLGRRDGTQAVADWRGPAARGVFPLPRPSWRNTGWLKLNPWFEAELLPALRARVREVLDV
jgi:uracil-DNA glycosylase